jgi:hypothetical protein
MQAVLQRKKFDLIPVGAFQYRYLADFLFFHMSPLNTAHINGVFQGDFRTTVSHGLDFPSSKLYHKPGET